MDESLKLPDVPSSFGFDRQKTQQIIQALLIEALHVPAPYLMTAQELAREIEQAVIEANKPPVLPENTD